MIVLDDEQQLLDRLAQQLASSGGPRSVQVHRRRDHRGSINVEASWATEGGRRDVFVKRMTPAAFDRYRASAGTHGVTMVSDPGRRLADEATVLRAIRHMVAQSGRTDWFAVGVDDDLSSCDMLVLDRISHPTLAERLARRDQRGLVRTATRSLGAWTRAFHGLAPFTHAVAHLDSRDAVVELAGRLIDRVDDPVLAGLEDPIIDAMRSLPSQLALRPSHGVLKATNVFVDDEGRVAVFDTSADSASPPHLDLARLVVDLEDRALQLGWSRPSTRRTTAADLADAVIEGYGPSAPDAAALRPFEILVVLDGWVAIAGRRTRGSGPARLAREARYHQKARLLRHQLLTRLASV